MSCNLPITFFTGISSGISADVAIAASNWSSFWRGVGTEVGTGHGVGGGLGGSVTDGRMGGSVDGVCLLVTTRGEGCVTTEAMGFSLVFGTHPHIPIM